MNQKLLLAGAVVAAFYYLSNAQGGTNADGSAEGGTDATIYDEVVNLLGAPDYINAWADAITIHEGWAVGSRSYRNNNPGNLEVTGDSGVDSGGYGVFSTYTAGRNALVSDLTAKVRKYGSWTLYQVMARYAPPSENNTEAYAEACAAALGCSTTTVVSSIDGLWAGKTWTPIAFPTGDTSTQPVVVASADSTQDIGDINSILIGNADGTPIDLSGLDLSGDS